MSRIILRRALYIKSMLIYVTEPREIDPEALELLSMSGHTVTTGLDTNAEALFIRTYTQATKEYLAQFPNLKYILRAGVGLDNIDVAECKRRSVEVINAPGANANAVAEYVVLAVLLSLRQIDAQRRSLAKGTWRSSEHMGGELKGKVLGLIGCGNVGKAIAKKLSGWELNEIIGSDPFLSETELSAAGIRKVELPEVLATADIISLHVPLLPETKHLINEETLSQMKRGVLLVNAARGGVIDEGALVAAIKSGQVSGAVLDVLEEEPEVPSELRALDTVILTPHIAGLTTEANKEVSLAPARALLQHLQRSK